MSKNLYDLFSEYKGELPEIEEKSCDSERIKQLVHKQTEKKNIKVNRNPKIFFISVAAALAAATSVTAAAYTGGFGHFKEVLRNTDASAAVNSELPLVNGGDELGMEQNISVDTIAFTGSAGAEVKTAGMYYDNNTLMLAVEMKFAAGTVIPDNAVVVPYFTKKSGGSETELKNISGLSNAAELTKGSEDGTYYATFYLTEKDLAGSTIGVCIENVITRDDLTDLQTQIIAEQTRWHEEFGDNGDTAAWKAYWNENNFDKRTEDFMSEYLAGCAKAVEGSWSAEIEVPDDISREVEFEANGFKATADTLSLTLDVNRDIPEGAGFEPVITLKDGTVIFSTGTNETEWLRNNGVFTDDKHEGFAGGFSNIYSYKKPHSVDDIAEIGVYVFDYDGSQLNAEGYTVYKAK